MQLLCLQCNAICDTVIVDGILYEVKLCLCGKLFCGNCARSKTCCTGGELRELPLLSKIFTFINNAPEEEAKLIDIQTGLKTNCDRCHIKYTYIKMYRFEIQLGFCSYCDALGRDGLWTIPGIEEDVFCQIINLIREHGMPRLRTQISGTAGVRPVRIADLNCKQCGQEIWMKHKISGRPFLLDGAPYCYDCGPKLYNYFPKSQRCYCVRKFMECIGCIPENQLHLLTYAKWVKAVDCELHQDILNELTAVSSDGSRKQKLRDFFKPEYSAEVPLPMLKSTTTHTASAHDIEKLTSALAKVDVSTPLTVAKKRVVCPCGREDELSNVFVCNTCSAYGICSLCLARNHWGHEIQDTLKVLTVSKLNTHSESTLHTLTTWSEQAKELNEESEKAFKQLCSALGDVFADATISSEDRDWIQTLLVQTDISFLEVLFKDTRESTIKMQKAVESFCGDLANAVKQRQKQEKKL